MAEDPEVAQNEAVESFKLLLTAMYGEIGRDRGRNRKNCGVWSFGGQGPRPAQKNMPVFRLFCQRQPQNRIFREFRNYKTPIVLKF